MTGAGGREGADAHERESAEGAARGMESAGSAAGASGARGEGAAGAHGAAEREEPKDSAGGQRLLGVVRRMIAIFLALFYRVSAEGRENVPDSGAAIICANHVCFKDLLLIGACVRRKVRWIAKAELFRNPLFGALITALGAFPVERGASDRSAVETVYGVLRGGGVIGIFPEGGRVRDPARRPRAKRGFVSFALNARAPLIPVSIKYVGGPFGPARLFSRIHVSFGEKVVLDYGKKYERAELMAIGDEIMDGIYARMDGPREWPA